MIKDSYKVYLSCMMFLFLLSSLSAFAPTKVSYLLDEKEATVELFFENGPVEAILPSDANELEVSTKGYKLESERHAKRLIINDSSKVKITYKTKSVIDKSGNDYFFVLENTLENAGETIITLPEFAALSEPLILFPSVYELTTDGRSVSISFQELSEEQILIKYEFPSEGSSYTWLLILLVLGIGAYFILKRYFPKKVVLFPKELSKENKKERTSESKEHFTKNLYEDEKRIVEFLLEKEKKECWTKELVRGLDITKVKLSRKLRSLEQKGLIKKIPYGNENKIRLID